MHVADPTQPPRGVFAYTLHPRRPAMLTEGATDVLPFQPMLMGAWPPEAARAPAVTPHHPDPETIR
jgi:hypothetical protein